MLIDASRPDGGEEVLGGILRKLYLEPETKRNIAEAARKSIASLYANNRVWEELTGFCDKVINSKRP